MDIQKLHRQRMMLGDNLSAHNANCLIGPSPERKFNPSSSELRILLSGSCPYGFKAGVNGSRILKIDRSNWDAFFHYEERRLLHIASKFYRTHQCLFMHRSRHYINMIELSTIASCASMQMRRSAREWSYFLRKKKGERKCDFSTEYTIST